MVPVVDSIAKSAKKKKSFLVGNVTGVSYGITINNCSQGKRKMATTWCHSSLVGTYVIPKTWTRKTHTRQSLDVAQRLFSQTFLLMNKLPYQVPVLLINSIKYQHAMMSSQIRALHTYIHAYHEFFFLVFLQLLLQVSRFVREETTLYEYEYSSTAVSNSYES